MKKINALKASTGPARQFSENDAKAVNEAARRNLVQDVQELETRAMGLGLYITMRALNRAKNALGYEIAGDFVKAEGAALPLPKKH